MGGGSVGGLVGGGDVGGLVVGYVVSMLCDVFFGNIGESFTESEQQQQSQ